MVSCIGGLAVALATWYNLTKEISESEGENMSPEVFKPEIIDTLANAGQALIASPAVQGVVSFLITTLFFRKGENIKVMEALKKKEFEKILEELLGAGRLSYVELYKCRNFLEIAKRADEMIASNQERQPEMEVEENVDQTTFSFDWLMRFFDAVGNISNENLQQLWGKVLANEIAKPKACSLRTLDMIRNMSSEEANIFSDLCRYVMQSGNIYYIDAAGFFCEEDGDEECREFIRNRGLSYERHIVPLLEAGALSQDHDMALYISKGTNLEMHNDKICGIVMSYADVPELFRRDAYLLTASGKELYSVIQNGGGFEADEEYAVLCLKGMKERNSEFYVGAFLIAQGGEGEDLLEN